MGKIAKPQKSKKHKKLLSINTGSKGKSRTEGLNQKPRSYDQEVPRRLRDLGMTIKGVQVGKVGKKSKNKFLKAPDGPAAYKEKFAEALKTAASESESSKTNAAPKKKLHQSDEDRMKKKDTKNSRPKIPEKVFNEYVDNLKPSRPFVEPFNFKKKQDESYKDFNKRVENEANRALIKSKLDEHFDVSDEKKMRQKMVKLKKGMSEKKKQRLKEKKLKKTEAEREKKSDRQGGFAALKDDKVQFGEVVHAPPTLSVRPKKAVVSDNVDRPGLRMPELKAQIANNMKESMQQRQVGSTLKRRDMSTLQQRQADSQREGAIEAYRALKRKIKH